MPSEFLEAVVSARGFFFQGEAKRRGSCLLVGCFGVEVGHRVFGNKSKGSLSLGFTIDNLASRRLREKTETLLPPSGSKRLPWAAPFIECV